MDLMWRQNAASQLRREYATTSATDARHACLAAAATAPYSSRQFAVPALEHVEERWGRSDCTAVFLTAYMFLPQHDSAKAALVKGVVQRALATAPQVPAMWTSYADVLRALGDAQAGEAAERVGLARVPAGMPRLRLQLDLVARVAAHDSAAAARLLRAAGREVMRDGRPGLRAMYLLYLPRYAGYGEGLPLVRAAGAWAMEYEALVARVRGELDGGDLAAALRHIDRAITLADRHRRPALQLLAYTLRGRICAKMGRLKNAERDLLHAARTGEPIDEAYLLGEAYHNLAHVYESARDWPRAVRAIDHFVQIYDPLTEYDARVVSLYDAATIRWKAGRHAAARLTFEAMVRAIERQHTQYSYGGEYYERAGELRQALDYYRRGLAEDRALALAGMTRVYELLGLADSAEATARAHDAAPGMWKEGPMLPALLARHGRTDAALRTLDDWIHRQEVTRNLQSAVAGLLESADILLAARRPGAAAEEAAHAESLATAVGLTRERIRAQCLRGSALAALGRTGAGLAFLRRAAAGAARHPEAGVTLESYVALGNALAKAGISAEALVAYDRAARSVERVTTLLDADIDRARFRDVHMAPFDGAMRLLLRSTGTSVTLDALLRWSERRKAEALALAAGSPRAAAGPPGRDAGTRTLQARLARGEALVDFTVLDSLVAAVVVSPHGARLLHLRVRADTLAHWSEALRTPFVAAHAGRLDLARATYDVGIAARLYMSLVAPLEPELRGATRLLLVPDGPLQRLPFEALVLPASPPAWAPRGTVAPVRFLADRYETTYLPSVRFLRRHGDRALAGEPLLLTVYDAPGGLRELAAIRSAWTGSVRVLTDAQASERAVRQAAPGFALLHLATHAVADERDALASYLRLAPGAGDDGLLHLPEIAELRVRARLVVLSGCETVEGPTYQGEGLMGLARAFLVAGAGAVLAARWPIGDATADLMSVFYRRLAVGDAPATALHAAQLALRRDPIHASPFFWAGFVLVRGQ